jgi:hypothetical protein
LEEDGEGYVLKNKVKNPFPMNYRPELDVSDELGSELSSRYLQLIGLHVGQLNWDVTRFA